MRNPRQTVMKAAPLENPSNDSCNAAQHIAPVWQTAAHGIGCLHMRNPQQTVLGGGCTTALRHSKVNVPSNQGHGSHKPTMAFSA